MGLTHSFAADEAEAAPARTFSARALPDEDTLILRKKPRIARYQITRSVAGRRVHGVRLLPATFAPKTEVELLHGLVAVFV